MSSGNLGPRGFVLSRQTSAPPKGNVGGIIYFANFTEYARKIQGFLRKLRSLNKISYGR